MTIHSKLAEIKERCEEAAKYDSYAPLNVAEDVETLIEVIECLTEALTEAFKDIGTSTLSYHILSKALTEAQDILERVK